MENNNELKRKSLMLGEFDVKVILDCLDKELSLVRIIYQDAQYNYRDC